MSSQTILCFISVIALIHISKSYKTPEVFRQKFKELQRDPTYDTTDLWIGKAMDLMYSNKTVMSIIAGALWNVGSKAVDKIVEAKRPT
ncbi:hypothetical protein NE865_10578 [Phthorimaea operculella]|nr:hypothetical protein NE865_10578 [Phthorimaea operculella]